MQRAPHRRDVSKNALKELPECVCNMGNLTSLYAPPEEDELVAAPRALLPQERAVQRAASAAEPRKLPNGRHGYAALRVRPSAALYFYC